MDHVHIEARPFGAALLNEPEHIERTAVTVDERRAHGRTRGLPIGCANPLTQKLSKFAQLSQSDRNALNALACREVRFPADVDILTEGMAPRSAFFVREDMAIRYRLLPGGGRQIMTFLIPGDVCNFHTFVPRAMDHSVATLTPVRIAPISRESVMQTFTHCPRVSAALWWSSMQEEAMLRERIVSLGRRDARGRVAYLLCELLWRHAAVGMAPDERFHFPLTQTELGDTLGITPVYVNRILKEFRAGGLIAVEYKMLQLLDIDELRDIAEFDQSYLQLHGAAGGVAWCFDEPERVKPVSVGLSEALPRQKSPKPSAR